MSDILRQIIHSDSDDTQGNLSSLADWSEEIAKELAKQESITLNADHFRLLKALRNEFRQKGKWKNARSVLKILENEVASSDPRKTLYKLFPKGPVIQSCKLAGLPVPADSADPSFGNVH